MAAVSLDVLSEGRFRLGLGLSGPQVSEGWYGVPFTNNLRRTREYVDVVRRALAREPILMDMEGGIDPAAPLGLGKPLKLLAGRCRSGCRSTWGRSGRRPSVRPARSPTAGCRSCSTRPSRSCCWGRLREGAESAGRSLADIDIAPVVPLAIDEDLDAARDAVRPWLAFYLGSMGAKDKNFYVELAERQGHGAAAREVQEKGLAGDRLGAAAAVTDGLVDAGAIATTPAGLDERLAIYERAGVTTLVAVPCGDDKPGVLRALAAATVTR